MAAVRLCVDDWAHAGKRRCVVWRTPPLLYLPFGLLALVQMVSFLCDFLFFHVMQELAGEPDLIDQLGTSLAPSIYGYQWIKKVGLGPCLPGVAGGQTPARSPPPSRSRCACCARPRVPAGAGAADGRRPRAHAGERHPPPWRHQLPAGEVQLIVRAFEWHARCARAPAPSPTPTPLPLLAHTRLLARARSDAVARCTEKSHAIHACLSCRWATLVWPSPSCCGP